MSSLPLQARELLVRLLSERAIEHETRLAEMRGRGLFGHPKLPELITFDAVVLNALGARGSP